MRKEYTFTGMSTRPAANAAPGGELDYCAELVNDGDGLKRIEGTDTDSGLSSMLQSGDTVLYVSGNTIVWKGTRNDVAGLYYNNVTSSLLYAAPLANIKKVSSLGNYLVVLTSAGVQYALLEDGAYRWLGIRPEMPSLRFGLQLAKKTYNGTDYNAHFLGEYEHLTLGGGEGENFEADEPSTAAGMWTFHAPVNTSAKKDWEALIQTAVVKLEAELAEEGLLSGNLWIRYGYRMKTGETAFLSAPVLLCANTGQGPKLLVGLDKQSGTKYVDARINPIAFAYKIVYKVLSKPAASAWDDLIAGIDFYITKPLPRYDYSDIAPDTFGAADTDEQTGSSVIDQTRAALQKTDVTFTEGQMFPYGFSGILMWQNVHTADYTPERILITSGVGINRDMIGVMSLSDNPEWEEQLRRQGPFYRLLSMTIDELPSASDTVRDLEYGKDELRNITQKPVLEDTYRDLDAKIAETVLPYNSRLNLANVSYSLFAGHPASELIPLFSSGNSGGYKTVKISVHVKENGKEYVVETSSSAEVMSYQGDTCLLLHSFFYPNSNAYKAVFCLSSETGTPGLTLNLRESPTLNGAYWVNESMQRKSISPLTPPTATTGKPSYPNQVMQSNVALIIFPAKGVQNVGQNTIRALATTAKSVHAYQSGQDPLYVFTEDAVWAMSLADDGTYLTCRPATFDAIRGAAQPVQTDDSVAFISQNGIRVLAGGESVDITSILDSQATFRKAEVTKDGTNYITGFEPADISARFRDYLASAFLAFDNENKRLYVFNPSKSGDTYTYPYGYVFSKETKTWSLTTFKIFAYAVQNYPDTYMVDTSDNDVKIKTFSAPSSDSSAKQGLVVTRPIEVADGLLFNVSEVIAHGVFTSGCTPQLALYGTLDFVNWQLIATAGGPHRQGIHCPPFKAIRLAVSASMKRRDTLTGFSIEYQPRHTARLR